jgi:4-hydroxythreonine-4-phosphate dehydrogenase
VRPRPLALSLGDPAGIGPEITVKAWQALRGEGLPFMVVGDAQALASASSAGASIIRAVASVEEAGQVFEGTLPVLDLPLRTPVVAGRASAAAAASIIRWIETAVGLALSGQASGLVTAPIAKAPLYEAGFRFPGHTEFLGELTASTAYPGIRGPVMMLTAQDLRTSLVTIHEPLSRVAKVLSAEAIVRTVMVTAQALTHDFGVDRPRLALAALNPHAGEGGALGREEVEVLTPVATVLRERGIDIQGPLPADTLFHGDARARYDAVVCLYHDQALIPVKMLDFWGGVNVTLGLPIVRTSPDHGVGYDIAGRGLARADSLIAAVRLAGTIAAQRAAA